MKIPETLKWKATGKTLGQGGQGVVHEVINKEEQNGKKYALKALSKGKPLEAYQRFYREIKAIKELNHPNIIKIFDHSNEGDDFNYYVMESIEDAVTLGKLSQKEENPFLRNALKSLNLFRQLATVIKKCESVNVVHRDLSPANILILPDEMVKVIDFGICQIEGQETITLVDENIGTANYRAPECEFGGVGEISSKSDIYSAGKIFWSAITGLNAFAREKPLFNSASMRVMYPDQPELWHLHHIFARTVRSNPGERSSPDEAVHLADKIRAAVANGYPPLELMVNTCPICGLGELERDRQAHRFFAGNIPKGIAVYICTYCGNVLTRNEQVFLERLKSRQTLE